MAFNPCEPCDCIGPNISDVLFHQQALVVLCNILTAIEADISNDCTCVTDGEAVDAADTGNLVAGTDGTNYQFLSVSTTGAVNINGAKAEDSAAVTADLGFPVLAVQTATPASTAADGDYGWLKTDALGKLWTADNQTEDLGHTTGDRGSFVLAVRNDSAAALTTTDLDYSPFAVDSAGRLKLSASTLSLGDIANITTSVTPGTAAANLGKAEDSAATNGATGVIAFVVRENTPAISTDTDGDYTWMKSDSLGKLWTADNQVEDAVHSGGDRGSFILGVRNDNAFTWTNSDGDYSPVSVNLAGATQIDINSDFRASAAKSILKLEDVAHASGDAGVAAWGVRNSAFTTFCADGDYSPIGTGSFGNVAVTLVGDSGFAQANSAIRFEDSAHSSGDAGVPAWGVNNASVATIFNSTNGDYTPIAVTGRGAVMSVLVYDDQTTDSKSPVRQEDQPSASADAGMVVFSVQTTTPASTAASGDYITFKSNDVGALYTEPANQVATWAAATIAGAAGGITTAGANALTNSAKVKRVELLNTTDQIVQLSLDAGTTWVLTAPATTGVAHLDLGTNGRWTASNISVRSIGSNTSSGSAYISVMI